MKKPKILERGSLIYVVYPDKVIVGVGGNHWITYNQYNNWNRQGITKFRQILLKSKENEYSSPVDQMSLAVQCGIKSASTQKPKELS